MKRLLFLFALIGLFITAQAQVEKSAWGATSDSLKKSTTKTTDAISVASNKLTVGTIQIVSDSLSGAPAYTVKIYKSLDGVAFNLDTTFVKRDSLKASSKYINWYSNTSGIQSKYLKVQLISNATTQKSKPTVYIRTWEK